MGGGILFVYNNDETLPIHDSHDDGERDGDCPGWFAHLHRTYSKSFVYQSSDRSPTNLTTVPVDLQRSRDIKRNETQQRVYRTLQKRGKATAYLHLLTQKFLGKSLMSLKRIRPLSPSSNSTAVKFSSSDSSHKEKEVT